MVERTLKRLEGRIAKEEAKRSALAERDARVAFAVLHHVCTGGRRLTFDGRGYLLPVYCDRSPRRVVKKCVQCGLTEFLIIDAFEAADRGLSCLYVMPTQEKRNTFVANRVTRAVRLSGFYRKRVRSGAGQSNSAGLKHFGAGTLRFVGSNSVNEFIEFPADLVTVDEYDRCSQEHMPLVRDRLAASEWKLEAYVSTPTHPAFGIASMFDASDAKEWFVRCASCGHAQPLDFFRNVVAQVDAGRYEPRDVEWARADGRLARDLGVLCVRCGRRLDRLGQGEWVARHPGRGVSGYHVSQLFVPTCRIGALWADWQKALTNDFERQRFYNSMLGEPYAPAGCGLSMADLAACCRDYEMPMGAKGCTMGVDVGEWFHVRISDRPEPGVRRAVFIGRVKTTEDLDRLIERYGVECCVIDAQPEALLVRRWQQSQARCRVWRCFYVESDEHEVQRDAADGSVRVSRTQSLDDATEDVRLRRNWLPRNAGTLDEGGFAEQMLAPVRMLEADHRGNPRYVWTRPAADHYRHADNYDKLASRLAPPRPAVRVVTGGLRVFKAA